MNKYYIFLGKLANPMRIRILSSLKTKGKSVNELVKELRIEQSNLSHALKSLKACNIVYSKRKGKQMIYSLNKETILPIFSLIDKHEKKFCKQCFAKRKK